jgi:hypothetical protein
MGESPLYILQAYPRQGARNAIKMLRDVLAHLILTYTNLNLLRVFTIVVDEITKSKVVGLKIFTYLLEYFMY